MSQQNNLQYVPIPRHPDRDMPTKEARWTDNMRKSIAEIISYDATVDLTSIGATSYSEQTVTINGVTTNHAIIAIPAGLTAGLYYVSARIVAANTVKVVLYNSTGGAIDEASASWSFITIRK